MARSVNAPVETLIIFGANGDLTSRLLLPGLGSLLASSRGRDIQLIGFGQADLGDDAWREKVRTAFSSTPSTLGTAVADSARFVHGDATKADDLKRVLGAATGRAAVYFALPPAVTEASVKQLRELDLPDGLVLALEKPFGHDAASAKRLNRMLETMLPEDQIFRVDHFLGKSTVLDLLGIRFANRLFEPLLSSVNVARIEIVVDEKLGLEGRAGYYDQAGALTDMIQSHLLQVLSLATMEPPPSLSSEDLRGSMAQVLRATRPWRADGTASRRARYTAGDIDGRHFPSYVDEPGVDPERDTETLAELVVAIDTWRWAGVPVTLRSGKAIGSAIQQVIYTFRPVPHLPTGFDGPSRDAQFRVGLAPNGEITLDLVTNGRGDPFDLEWDTMRTTFDAGELKPYGEVLGELLAGDPTLSVRGDVAEQCWRIVEPVLKAWRKNAVPLEEYRAGSDGPRRWSTPIV